MNRVRYLETAKVLAAELAGSAPGAKIGSENEIASRFGVSAAAARAAAEDHGRPRGGRGSADRGSPAAGRRADLMLIGGGRWPAVRSVPPASGSDR
jgi:hypothetical protein